MCEYKENQTYVNFMDNVPVTIDAGKGNFIVYDIVVSSAIIGVAGSGHLCLGYLSTSTFSVPTSPEESTTQLRTYLGACVTQSDSILIIPNCFVEGISAMYAKTNANTFKRMKKFSNDLTDAGNLEGSAITITENKLVSHEAARIDGNGKVTSPNLGPLGNLDRLDGGLGSITAGIVVRKMD
jgi:hypothetical protein